MDLLANYDDDNTEENSISNSPSNTTGKSQSNLAPNLLENEWLSFEQMIAPGGGACQPVRGSDFLVNGIVAYPGMKGMNTVVERGLHGAESTPALEEQSSASCDNETATGKAKQDAVTADSTEGGKKDDEDDDAFFKLRKQVKERDRSDSSVGSGSSGSSSASSSRSVSPSPPHLSPVNSIKSQMSEPPDLTAKDVPEDKVATGIQVDIKVQDKKKESIATSESKRRSKSKERKRSRSRDRKKSHRDHRSKHDHSSSKSKRRHSRSRSKDRRHRRSSRDRHRHKDKKSRDRKSSRSDEKRSQSQERKDNKSESRKSEGRDRKDSKSEIRTSESHDQTEVKKSVSHETKGSKSHRKHSRSRSRDKKDKKKDRRRSRSRHRHRSKSKDRRRSRSKERKRSKSRERRKKHRSRSRHRSRDRHSRSRSRERLRSRSPVLGRKLTFKEQMRKEFIMASKEMVNENKALPDLTTLRKPGEALRTADLLKTIKLTGESVTPQMALIQTMAAMHKKAQELTGVEVPKYYNPAAVNPLKYAEQVQKRKLLWSKKTEEKDKNDQMEAQWKSAFVATEDNTASKFRKLMGMKEGEGHSSTEELPEEIQKLSEEQQRKHEEMFQRLDHEYQFARMTTHTQRGVGLGFATTVIDPNHPHNPP